MNPMFNRFQANQMPQGGMLGNISNLLAQFQQFRQNFQGNPEDKVRELLDSGQMSQDQFQQLSNMAEEFQKLLGRR